MSADRLDDARRALLNAHQALMDGIGNDALRPSLIAAVAQAQAALDAMR
jgi:hypothetical protein